MKKLLMLGAILVLGATAFAKGGLVQPNDENVAEANVTVKAQLVAENLVISDLEGNPLVLDFEKVNKRETGIRETSEGLLVKYVGEKDLTNNGITMELKGDNGFVDSAVPVTLSALSQAEGKKADTFEAVVGLDSYAAKLEKGTTYDTEVYQGRINGTLDCANTVATANGVTKTGLAELSTGDYQGQTVLKVTINDGNPLA